MEITIFYKPISEARYKKLVSMNPKRAYGCMINEAPLTIRGNRIQECYPIEEGGDYFIKYMAGGR